MRAAWQRARGTVTVQPQRGTQARHVRTGRPQSHFDIGAGMAADASTFLMSSSLCDEQHGWTDRQTDGQTRESERAALISHARTLLPPSLVLQPPVRKAQCGQYRRVPLGAAATPVPPSAPARLCSPCAPGSCRSWRVRPAAGWSGTRGVAARQEEGGHRDYSAAARDIRQVAAGEVARTGIPRAP